MGHEVVVVARNSPDSSHMSPFGIRSAIRVTSGQDREVEVELSRLRPDRIFIHNLFPNFGWSWIKDFQDISIAFIHNYRFNCSAGTYFRSGTVCKDCLHGSKLHALFYGCYKDSRLATLPLMRITSGRYHEHPFYSFVNKIVVGSALGRDLLSQWGVPGANLYIIPNFTPAQEPISKGNSVMHWVYAGRLVREKGIIELIRDFPSSRQLHVVGSGPLQDAIFQMATPNITLRPHIANAALQEQLRRACGLVVPSLWFEVNPVVAAEAYSRGQPVVAFRQNAVGQELVDIDRNLVYESATELSRAIQYVESHFEAVQEAMLGLHARQYSWKAWQASIQLLLENREGTGNSDMS